MLEFASQYDFDNIVLIQATSPMIKDYDLDKGFEKMYEPSVDSVMSVVRQERFNWKYDNNGFVYPLNYDYMHRPRPQEFEGYLTENGAFYITSKARLMSTKSRISGNIKAVEMCKESFYEIDVPSDFEIVGNLMKWRESN